ncbi:hypothetical protein FO519_008665 [Halicephalobus sp. NKZ332]|nr:hypothetical protein FO519_008665 [Halicephalobus sp. NKZ332]
MPFNMTFDAYDSNIYQHCLTISGIIATVSGFMGMYLTLIKSPPNFGFYKYFLFNICFWSFLNDFYLAVIYRPKILFPAITSCPTGIFKTNDEHWGFVSYCIFMVFFGASSVSIITAFVYRFANLNNYLSTLLKPSSLVILGVLHLFYELPSIVLDTIAAVKYKDEIIAAVVKDYPNIVKHLVGQGCAVLHIEVGTSFAFIIACCIGFGISVPIVSFLIYKCFRILIEQRSYMSPKTFRLHKRLLISLIFQLLAPVCGLFGPFMAAAYLCFTGRENVEFFGMTTMVCGTLHSFFNTLMMVYFIPHYRRIFLSIVLRKNISPSSVDTHSKGTHQGQKSSHIFNTQESNKK